MPADCPIVLDYRTCWTDLQGKKGETSVRAVRVAPDGGSVCLIRWLLAAEVEVGQVGVAAVLLEPHGALRLVHVLVAIQLRQVGRQHWPHKPPHRGAQWVLPAGQGV